MQFSLLNGDLVEAFPGGRARCPKCGAVMVAKCGPRVLHHWAHEGQRNCDPWWENETDWHRQWKNLFQASCREVSHVAPNGEIHRADVKTPTGIYIEVQHSSMSDAERISREAFYQNLVWVIDGSSFRNNFDLYHFLPDPKSNLARDLVWFPAQRGMNGSNAGAFWRRSENPDVEEGSGSMVLVHPFREIREEVMASYIGHQQYDWVRPRKTWLSAGCPVFVDFGDDWLFRLEQYGDPSWSNLKCVFRVAKRKFLHDVMVETRNTDIATRFYPIAPANSEH